MGLPPQCSYHRSAGIGRSESAGFAGVSEIPDQSHFGRIDPAGLIPRGSVCGESDRQQFMRRLGWLLIAGIWRHSHS